VPIAETNGIKIAYETHGKAGDPAVLMIMGLGAQLSMWSQRMIDMIVEAGHYVVVFDNRDIGLSEKFHTKRPPNLIAQIAARRVGIKLRAPYTLYDMAKDTVGLMDALNIEQAHVVGVSMGGMISQILSGKYPQRVLSLTAIMTTTGNPKLPRPSGNAMKALARRGPPPATREDAIDQSTHVFSVIGTPGEDHTTNGYRDRIATSYDRNYNPKGLRRQTAAIIASGDFRRMTKKITAPTLVIHGKVDPLVPVEGGMDVHDTVAHSKLHIIDDMGHDIPPRHLPEIMSQMLTHIGAVQVEVA